MRKDAPDTRSKLHANMLTAFGTHRYYSSDIADTCTMVDRLAEDSDPFFAIEAIYPAGFETTRHSHDRGQVTFVRDGMMSLVTDDQTLIVPARHAVWVPAHMSHQPLAQGHVCVMSAYAARECWGDLPGTCQVFQASDMLEPLIKRVIACQLTRDDGPIHDALLLLLHLLEAHLQHPLNHPPKRQNLSPSLLLPTKKKKKSKSHNGFCFSI